MKDPVLLGAVCVSLLRASWPVLAAPPAAIPPARHALLVGCTTYPSLPITSHLEGPANDVVLLRSLLTERFSFPQTNVTVLAEAAADSQHKPTRQNIAREFARLAQVVRSGDQVVILLGGHGSQQPTKQPQDPDKPEPDGLDEIFLPADIGKWTRRNQAVENAIVDEEFGAWTRRILERGAFVWVILDACHSGGMMRGNDAEQIRGVPPELLTPREVLDGARRQAAALFERTRGGDTPTGPTLRLSDKTPGWVAFYAALSSEPTVEKILPPDDPDQKPQGLLTYTLCQILTQARSPMTYRELMQRIQEQYVAWGRSFPTPQVEGSDRDREVLGMHSWPGRSNIRLSHSDGTVFRISAGALQGLTVGSVLAVFPAGDQGSAAAAGHVCVTELRSLNAVVQPCAYGKVPLNDKLPEPGRCELVYLDYGEQTLRVALDTTPLADAPSSLTAAQNEVLRSVQQFGQREHSPLQWLDGPAKADWLVRVSGGKAYLIPASGLAGSPDKARGRSAAESDARLFGPAVVDNQLGRWLDQRLQQIARAEHLLRLATPVTGGATPEETELQCQLELVKYKDAADSEGEVVGWDSHGRTLRPGDEIAFRMRNRGRCAADVTLLFIDSGYGITALLPRPGLVEDNRLPPGAPALKTKRAKVTDTTLGLEHVVAIAVKGKGAPVDFSCLQQPTLEQTRSLAGPGADSLDSPLGRLLSSALYGEGRTRGLEDAAVRDYTVQVISWRVHLAATP